MSVRAGYVLVMVALLLAVANNAERHLVQRELAGAHQAVVPAPLRSKVVVDLRSAEAEQVSNLVAEMNSGDRAKRSAAVAELGQFTASLFKALDTQGLRDDALRVLIEIGLEDQIPIATLGEITASGSPDAQRRAWGVLSRKDMFDPESRAAFARFTEEPSGEAIEARQAAIRQSRLALQAAEFGDSSSVSSLERLSRSDDARVRLMASDLLADRAKKVESIPDLIKLLDGSDPRGREMCAVALRDFGAKATSAVPALARHLADQSELVRLYSAYALASIGPAAREAVPALQQAAKSDDPALRSAATHALTKIVPAAERK